MWLNAGRAQVFTRLGHLPPKRASRCSGGRCSGLLTPENANRAPPMAVRFCFPGPTKTIFPTVRRIRPERMRLEYLRCAWCSSLLTPENANQAPPMAVRFCFPGPTKTIFPTVRRIRPERMRLEYLRCAWCSSLLTPENANQAPPMAVRFCFPGPLTKASF